MLLQGLNAELSGYVVTLELYEREAGPKPEKVCHFVFYTLLHHRILVLEGHQEVFNGGTSFKIYLYTIVAALFPTLSLSPL